MIRQRAELLGAGRGLSVAFRFRARMLFRRAKDDYAGKLIAARSLATTKLFRGTCPTGAAFGNDPTRRDRNRSVCDAGWSSVLCDTQFGGEIPRRLPDRANPRRPTTIAPVNSTPPAFLLREPPGPASPVSGVVPRINPTATDGSFCQFPGPRTRSDRATFAHDAEPHRAPVQP